MVALEFDTQIFESFQDAVMLLQEGVCVYANPEHRRLWIGTDSLILPKGEYRAIHPKIDQLVLSRSVGHETISVNKGSNILYYYLYCFPVNGLFYVILTRDITESYTEHQRDREYKGLFTVVFNAVRYPLAIVSTTGIVNRFTHAFFQCFDDNVTLSSGSFIWDFFGKDRPAVKELFEELVQKRQQFEWDGFLFTSVSDEWVAVYATTDKTIEKPEAKNDEEHAADILAFFRVVRSMKDLPWKAIIITMLGATTILGQIDPGFLLHLLDAQPVEQSK